MISPRKILYRVLLCLALTPLPLLKAGTRQVLDFNPGWRLSVGDTPAAREPGFDDAAWKQVTLPRAWNEDDAFRLAIDKHSTGITWYRKSFKLPENAKGKKIFIEFEGVRQGAEIWVNGRRVALHENGVMALGLDLSEDLKPAPATNVIAVRTDNAWDYRETVSGQRYQWSDRNFNANYGGIPKNVRLHICERVYQTLPLYSHLGTTGVYIYARDFDIAGHKATICAEAEVRNEAQEARRFRLRTVLQEWDGTQLASFESEARTLAPRESAILRNESRVSGLQFWSWGYGYLYRVSTQLVDDKGVFDSVETQTGFRKTEFADGMVKLNDRVLQMKGYAQRSSNEWPALGLSVPPWLSDFSNGLMVESGANLVRWMHITPWKQDVESCDRVGLMQMMPAGDSERDAQGRSWAQRLELMRDAIIYNRNNPSILVYESGNKGVSELHMAEMKAIRDRYDPCGGRAIGSREMLDSKIAEYGGEMLYINKSAGKPLWATEYSRDEALRKYWDEFSPPYHKDGDGPLYRNAPAREYNRNQDSFAIEDIVRWYDYWRERPGTGRRVSSGGVNIVFSDSNTHYRGAENYRRSGEVDAMRIPKDAFFVHQVMWDGWVDVEKPRTHLIGHWNYAAGTVKDVYVASSAEKVELRLNGKSLGFGERSHQFLFSFRKIAWEPGTLEAIGFDADGKESSTATLETAGPAQALRLSLKTAPKGLRADAADVALVEFEVVDAKGRRCPTAFDLVHFSLEGPAEWRGGLAQGPDNYILAKSLPVECGVNRVLLRSTGEAGRIRISAKAEGLAAATLEFDSLSQSWKDGYPVGLPSDTVRPRLDRGPTPAGPSFKVTRLPLSIAKATDEKGRDASAIFDDNEESSWVGKGPLSCELAQGALVSELCAKLSGWRARSYPIRITVDRTEVFRGVTPRSLGYITLPLKPTFGRKVQIEVLGGSEAKDAFGAVQELVDQKNATTGEQNVGKGDLGIVELELYAPVK